LDIYERFIVYCAELVAEAAKALLDTARAAKLLTGSVKTIFSGKTRRLFSIRLDMKLHIIVTVAILTVALMLTLNGCGAAHGMQPGAQTGFSTRREGDSLPFPGSVRVSSRRDFSH